MSNPVKPTDIGMNRTGTATSPFDSKKLAEGAQVIPPAPEAGLEAIEAVRLEWSRLVTPVGTMPPPGSLKGAVKAAVTALQGKHATPFLDLLGERLAFERTGTRLYDALLAKQAAAHPAPDRPSRDDLESIRDDELRHCALLAEAIGSLGGDPTVVTPSADVTGVASGGLVKVITDPRTTLTEALKAILIAELADNDAWLTLADAAARLGQNDLAARFQDALLDEERHLAEVRAWLSGALDAQLGLPPEPDVESPSPDLPPAI